MHELYTNCYATTLENGLRVLVEPRPDRPLSVGIWTRLGSRDEPIAGIAHFAEHMFFKGTTHRTAFQISEEVDALGGYINAMTHKEYTLFYIDVLPQHLEAALDILADLVKHPRFDESDIQKEHGVVLEEIRMSEDNPQEKVFDLFMERIWDDEHPLARPILGRPETVVTIHRQSLFDFHRAYHPAHFIVTAAGEIEPERVLECVKRHFGDLAPGPALAPRYAPRPHPHFYLEDRDVQQANLVLGVPSVGRQDERRFALEVLNTILGGGMSSRLFKKIREELGLAYAVFSSTTLFTDSGLFIIYVGTEPKNARQTVEISVAELESLSQKPVTKDELRLAKEKLKGNILLSLESSHSRMVRLGIGELYNIHGPIEDLIAKIEAVTAEELQTLARELFTPGALSLSVVGPEEKLSDLEGLVN
ncbi:MAG: insulinase family protein [Candidatus Bipolaricaulota bacterium]|nr:insulinase family protein [Candidatus Bipolaricaulota bacterium]MCS7274900.1 insulinase family protein [Candidatus Bipolaricaulota bacterium]MDW8111179.1 pitrilysin family protein [Candidatus Bipolaricaulota bacterium]MDW8329801.1 pitrilysin family protein [Candidatus Bipolaricaulota bacterium]